MCWEVVDAFHWLIIVDFVISLVKSNHLDWILILEKLADFIYNGILMQISCLAQWQQEVYEQLLNLQQPICVQDQTTAELVRK